MSSFIDTVITIDDITYYPYKMELSYDGELCIAFAYDDEETNYVLYTNGYNKPIIEWFSFPQKVFTLYTDLLQTTSFTENGILYVFLAIKKESTSIYYYYLDSLNNITVANLTLTDTTFQQGSAISVNNAGTNLSLSTDNGLYVIESESGNITTGNNTIYFTNSSNYEKNALQIVCSNLKNKQGFFITTNKIIFNYYINGSNVLTLNSLFSSTWGLLSNLTTIDSEEHLYLTDPDNKIYSGIVIFTKSGTTLTTTLFSDSYQYTYTHLKIYDMNNFIFSSLEKLVYSIDGVVDSYSNSNNNFSWCAISELTETNNIIMGACNSSEMFSLVSYVCFLQNTKITILEDGVELEKNIELLKNGDLVKTNPDEYRKINFIGFQTMNVFKDLDKIRVLPKNAICENLPFENLYLTTGHSLLFKDLKYANELYDRNVYDNNIQNYYKILSMHCSLCKTIHSNEIINLTNNNNFLIYHFSLEHENYDSQFAIYSNGVRSESMSYNYAIKNSKMAILNF